MLKNKYGENSKIKISFVVLHYLVYALTDACIESILETSEKNEHYAVDIIVVDNASNNGSCEKLMDKYASERNIHFIENEENLGFSRANNIGYQYAIQQLSPDYVFVVNNDTLIEQRDIFTRMENIYKHTNAFIIGPDVKTVDGSHQSPMLVKPRSRSEIQYCIFAFSKANEKLEIFLKSSIADKRMYVKSILCEFMNKVRRLVGRVLHSEAAIHRGLSNIQAFRSEPHMNPLLQGAALIFTPLFIQTKELPFEPETFLYCEEDILALRCKYHKWLTYYSPDICVTHLDDGATNALLGNQNKKNAFLAQHSLESAKVLLRYGDQIGW